MQERHTQAIQSNVPRTRLAYNSLRKSILDNSLTAGQQILEKDLVEQLGISRTPVREACVQLEREGLIEIRPRHGIFIKPISAKDMHDIYDILCALEPQAAKLAALRIKQGDLKATDLTSLTQATENMANALDNDDLTAWAEADEAYHFGLLELCDNERLKQVVLQFWGQAHRARMFTLPYRKKPTDSTADHIELVKAIELGEDERAFTIHAAHREKGKEHLLAIIKQFALVKL